MKTTLALILAGAAMVGAAAYSGMQYERQEHLRELAEAKADFKQKLSDAAQAYADQKVIDDAELKALREDAAKTPPNKTVALKKDAAKRIGKIR